MCNLKPIYSIKKQISSIFKKQCYRAMGISITPKVSSNMFPVLSQSTIIKDNCLKYQIAIANQVYQKYKQQDFKFCDHGTTPKTIAHQIQAHLRFHEDLEYEINQFGNFIVKPSTKFYNRLSEKLKNSNTDTNIFPLLQEYKQRRIRQVSQNIYIYHYIITKNTVLADILHMLSLNLQSNLQYGQVTHKLLISDDLQEKYKQSILNFFQKYIAQIQINRFPIKEYQKNRVFKTACSQQDVLQYQKYFPNHILHKYNLNPQISQNLKYLLLKLPFYAVQQNLKLDLFSKIWNPKNISLQLKNIHYLRDQITTLNMFNKFKNQCFEVKTLNDHQLMAILINFGDLVDQNYLPLAYMLVQNTLKLSKSAQNTGISNDINRLYANMDKFMESLFVQTTISTD